MLWGTIRRHISPPNEPDYHSANASNKMPALLVMTVCVVIEGLGTFFLHRLWNDVAHDVWTIKYVLSENIFQIKPESKSM